jgi:hypothetical protein
MIDPTDQMRAKLIARMNQAHKGLADSLDRRIALWRGLCREFGIEAIADIPDEKINPFKAAIDARIAAAVGGK